MPQWSHRASDFATCWRLSSFKICWPCYQAELCSMAAFQKTAASRLALAHRPCLAFILSYKWVMKDCLHQTVQIPVKPIIPHWCQSTTMTQSIWATIIAIIKIKIYCSKQLDQLIGCQQIQWTRSLYFSQWWQTLFSNESTSSLFSVFILVMPCIQLWGVVNYISQ